MLIVFVGDGSLDAVAAKPEVNEVVDSLLAFGHTTLKLKKNLFTRQVQTWAQLTFSGR